MKNSLLIYGANGYTGELITRYAVERGLRPLIAGRNAAAIEALAEKHGLEYRVFSLDDNEKIDAALEEVDMVLHCAGPFSLTSSPMVDACLRNKKHYADITGEISVFEMCARQDEMARSAGIMIMPGVGFDVVPSDCLALHLKNRLPSATHLTLAFYGKGGLSHGTQSTMTMNIGKGGAIRKNGKITPVPAAWRSLDIDFGGVTKQATTIPWGDVATAFYSTGIPNIEVYTVIPPANLRLLKISRWIGSLLETSPVQRFLQNRIPKGGPSDEQREKGQTLLWGRATDAEGTEVVSNLKIPEGYTTTVITALAITERILNGELTSGFQTPAKAYGADLVFELPEAHLTDK